MPSIKGGGGGGGAVHAQPSNLSDRTATFLASGVGFQASRPTPCFQHSSIKVYLSTILSLHIEQGFLAPVQLPSPPACNEGDQAFSGLSVCSSTASNLFLIPKALDLSTHDHCMFWATCTLGYFGFLRSTEFTVPNSAGFSPTTHLSVADFHGFS